MPAKKKVQAKSAAEEAAAKEVAAMKPAAKPDGVSEEEVRAKVAAGLTREQAIEVLKNQAAYDKAQTPTGKKG